MLVDSNVLLDIITNDPVWRGWSLAQLGRAVSRGPVAINDIIYAEISVRLPDVAACDAFVSGAALGWEPMPAAALFLAARAHQAYRRRGSTRPGVLSDFFIGAHALVRGWPVLTRDATRYRTAFPSLPLVTP